MGVETEGVTDITPGTEQPAAPSVEELQAQLKAMQDQQAAWTKEREQYLQALASVDTVVQERIAPRRQAREEQGGEEQDEELDPVLQRKLAKLREADDARYSTVQDQLDQLNFTQLASSMGVTQEDYLEVEKQYQAFRRNGVSVTDNTGVKRPLTRTDVLDRLLAVRTRGEMMKAAPDKMREHLRTKVIGQAQFEGVGSYEGAPRLVKLDSELDRAPPKDRVTKLEKALEGIEF